MIKFLEQRQKSIGQVLNCARHFKGLSREELAQRVSIGLSDLASIETGSLTPSLPQWKQLTVALEIPMDSIKTTFIDHQSLAELRTRGTEGGFRLPDRYGKDSCIKIRELLPYFACISEHYGWDVLSSWLQNVGVSPAFISSMDNQLSFDFYCDLANFMFDILGMDVNSASQIASYTRVPEFHGTLADKYRGLGSGLQVVRSYLLASRYYQCAFQHDLIRDEENLLEVRITPHPVIFEQLEKYDSAGLILFDQMREANIQSLSNGFEKPRLLTGLLVEETRSIYRGDAATVYRIQVA